MPPQEVVGHGQGPTMAFVGQVAGVRTDIMVDSGASHEKYQLQVCGSNAVDKASCKQ